MRPHCPRSRFGRRSATKPPSAECRHRYVANDPPSLFRHSLSVPAHCTDIPSEKPVKVKTNSGVVSMALDQVGVIVDKSEVEKWQP